MITALLSRPIDLLLALGLQRTPQFPVLFISKPSSTTRAITNEEEKKEEATIRKERREKREEGECFETQNKIEQQRDDLGSYPFAIAATPSVCLQSL